MAYNKIELFKEAKRIVKKHKLIFLADIFAYVPYSRHTFYFHFHGSDELDELKELIKRNR